LKILSLLLQLTSGIVLARILGASGYGIYAFSMSVVALLSIPATAGLPKLLIRNISAYYANKQFAFMRGILIRANQFVLFFSLTLGLAAVTVYFYFAEIQPYSTEGLVFILAMFLLPISALSSIRMAALRGLRMVLLGQLPEAVVKPFVFLGLIAVFAIVYDKNLSPQLIMALQLVAAFAAFLLGVVFLISKQPMELKRIKSKYTSKQWLKSALPFLSLGVMQIINSQTDIIMLNFYRNSSEVGVYKAVVSGSTLVTFILTTINIAISPQLARLWALGQKERMQKMITISSRIVAISVFLLAGILLIWGQFFLIFLFGKEFASGATALRILCFGQMINGLSGSVGNILDMTGHEKKSMQAVMISAILNVLLNFLLISKFGMNGAAIASTISLATWNIIMIFWVVKYVGLNSTIFGGCFSGKANTKRRI
jgi:O-antigen/teichoic acid export membrane protein